jgi:hypothetical protein
MAEEVRACARHPGPHTKDATWLRTARASCWLKHELRPRAPVAKDEPSADETGTQASPMASEARCAWAKREAE